MKRLRLLAAAIATMTLEGFASCKCNYAESQPNAKTIKASSKYETRAVATAPFSKIEATTIGDITYTQKDGAPSVKVTAPDNIIGLLDISVGNGTLRISTKGRHSLNLNGQKVEISVSSPSLTAVTLAGAATMRTGGTLTAQSLSLSISGAGAFTAPTVSCTDGLHVGVSGAGKVDIGNAKARNADVEASGAGKMKINATTAEATFDLSGTSSLTLSGTTTRAGYITSGASSIDATALKADHVTARATGASKVRCHAAKTLKATRSGAADIGYKGNPSVDQPDGGKLHKL